MEARERLDEEIEELQIKLIHKLCDRINMNLDKIKESIGRKEKEMKH